MNEVNESGRCPLHPSMQLRSRKKNGEWRILMDQCPLCISGLPGDGQSIEERYAEPPAPRQSELDDAGSYDDYSYGEQENRGSNEELTHLSPQPTRGDQRTPVKGMSSQVVSRSPAPFQQQLLVPTKLKKVNSYDSGATTEDEASSSNVYEDFRAFLDTDQKKMASASPKRKNGNIGSPGHHTMKGLNGSPKPRPNSPLSHSPNGRQMGQLSKQMLHRFPPPPHGLHQNGGRSRSNISPEPQSPIKRPDPESSAIPFQQHLLGRGARTPQNQQYQHKQRHSPYISNGYNTPNKPGPDEVSVHSAHYKTPRDPDEVSINSASRYKTPKENNDPDEVSVTSMNSVKRNLNKSLHNISEPPYTPHGDSYTNEHATPKPLEQDEVSAVSMNSMTRNLYYTKSNESTEGDEEASVSSEDKEIATSQCDLKGMCIRHPTVRLRKKKLFGGWQVVLSNCPECCLDEMRRVKEERSRSGKSKSGSGSRCGSKAESRGGKSKSSSKAGKKKKKKETRRERKEPPMSQVNIATNGEDDKSIGTASTITISSYTHASGGKPNPNEQTGPARVTRMPYTDHNGERGWYTGAVNGTTGTPHGFGTMNYSDGDVFEGQWLNGKSVSTEQQVHSPAKTRYPQPGHGVRRTNMPPPRSPLETHYEDDSRSSRSHSTRTRSTSRPRVRHPPPQQQQHTPVMQLQRKVVCGMLWTDSIGTGAYTGEVNGLNIPDGVGSMRYNSGMVTEGLWADGEMEEDANEEDELVSYQESGQLDGFLGRNNVRVSGNGSAPVM